MKQIVIQVLEKVLSGKMSLDEIGRLVEVPPQQEMGDFAFPCFSLAKIEKKSPLMIAQDLVEEIRKNLPKEISGVEVKSAYVNFFVDKKFLAEKVLKEATKKEYGSSREGKGKKIVIDYSCPNAGKPMHVGHIRSTVIGDAVCRLAKFNGDKPISINYLGDIGLHIGKLIVAWELWLDRKKLKEDPTKELLRLYVEFCKKEKSEVTEGSEEDPYANNEWTLKAKEKLKLIEDGDKKANKIWEDIKKASIVGFNRVYKKLDVSFDEITGQSYFTAKGKEVVSEGIEKGIFKKEETGAAYAEFGDQKKFVLRSNGTAFYMTQDIGAAVERSNKYKFDKMIYVTDYRQNLHFSQLFEILGRLGYSFSKDCSHIGFGTINFGEGIMATREGKVILLEEVIDKITDKVKEQSKLRNSNVDPLAISIAALKYAILRIEPGRDVEFSWERALEFEGNTGPYLLYSYARASSILRKVEKKKQKLEIFELSPQETALLTKLQNFPDIVKSAYTQLAPNLIANYAYELAQTFNEFYHAHPVIGSREEAFRLKLIEAFRNVLKTSLNLLGINELEEM
jgi:arginyl-tRNA synthetase